MSTNFEIVWESLNLENKNQLMIAADAAKISAVQTGKIGVEEMSEYEQETLQHITVQYVRGEVTTAGLEAMSNPDYWEKTAPYLEENIMPQFMQEYHQSTAISELDELIKSMSDFAYLDATGMQGNNHALPNLKDMGLSIAG